MLDNADNNRVAGSPEISGLDKEAFELIHEPDG
jgi:hypothetical protein